MSMTALPALSFAPLIALPFVGNLLITGGLAYMPHLFTLRPHVRTRARAPTYLMYLGRVVG